MRRARAGTFAAVLVMNLALAMAPHAAAPGPPNTPPTASFAVTPSSATTGTNFLVNASASSDTQDPSSALQVRWDWTNDSAWDTTYATTKTATHNYSQAGTYTIRLQVVDTGGLTSNTTRTVTVTWPPLVLTTYVQELAGVGSAEVVVKVNVTGGVPPYSYHYDFGDGTTATVLNPDHTYARAGVYTVVVTVTDSVGQTAQGTNVQVVTTTTPPGGGGSPLALDPLLLGAIGGVAVAAIVAVALLAGRRQGRGPPPPGSLPPGP